MIAVLLLLIIGITFLCVLGLWHYLAGRHGADGAQRRQVATQGEEVLPGRLEVNPTAELGQVRAAETTRLNSYGWIDRKAGVAHIPIEEAMQLLVARGLPEVGGGQTRLQMMQALPQGNLSPNEHKTSPAPEVTP